MCNAVSYTHLGRPDADDLEYAKLFGEKIRAKIAAAEDMEKLYGVDVTRIPVSYTHLQRPRLVVDRARTGSRKALIGNKRTSLYTGFHDSTQQSHRLL